MTPDDQLIDDLSPIIGHPAAQSFVAALAEPGRGSNCVAAVQALLGELRDISVKVARGAIASLPDLQRRTGLDDLVAWLDLGVTVAAASGAAGLRYFSESPLILSLIPPGSARQTALRIALELADNDRGDANTALEFFRQAPELVQIVPLDQLAGWTEMGAELARCDYVLGIEFFRQAPAIARVIPADEVRGWTEFGMKLITQNSLGKTDYLGTLEFFRTCPGLLAEIEDRVIRGAVVRLGSTMADHSPEAAIQFLVDAPSLLRRVPLIWQPVLLQYGILVAERDAEAALHYVRRCPEVLELLPEDPERRAGFESWFKVGMEVLQYSIEGGRSFFALETTKALDSVEQAMAGVPLRQVARTLKLFVEALSGSAVTIRAAEPPAPDGKGGGKAAVSAGGRTISLPPLLRRYPTREQNIRLYTIMTAHEAGHLEYGTYGLDFDRLRDLSAAVQARYGPERGSFRAAPLANLAELFDDYPQPRLIQDIWMVLEDARVEFRLKHDYPGLRHDLAVFARDAVTTRSLLHGMSVREMVVDSLLLLSTAERENVELPDAIRDLVESAWNLCQTILTPTAAAEDVVRLADRLYVMLEEHVRVMSASSDQDEQDQQDQIDQGLGPQSSEQQTSNYRPVTNWDYRGDMDPHLIRREQSEGESRDGPEASEMPQTNSGQQGSPAPGSDSTGSGPERSTDSQTLTSGRQPSSIIERLLSLPPAADHHTGVGHEVDRVYTYDEWDGALQDYRAGWCRVIEQRVVDGDSDFASTVRTKHGPAMRLLRRYFETIRPSELRRLHGQTDGDEIDLDAAIRHRVDVKAGAEPSDRVYLHRQKRDRSVVAAFLVDLSGSTSRHITQDSQQDTGTVAGRRIIDVEKEGLVLLSDALDALGDQYAIYGYSGQGRAAVDFRVLKDFDEPDSRGAAQRIGVLEPLQQNRDGAAIRHATRKLRERDAKVRLLILLSDGKPLDDRYADEYSLEDTKMALREARRQGIEPFCITVDRQADDYLRRMYGDVGFVVIDQVEALPQRLPRIYQRLTT
jgi:nitric oxide reductase NorD protein